VGKLHVMNRQTGGERAVARCGRALSHPVHRLADTVGSASPDLLWNHQQINTSY